MTLSTEILGTGQVGLPPTDFRPLVEPGPPLGPELTRRFARQLNLPGLGSEGQRRLGAAKVLIIGAGALGSPVVEYLVAAGVAATTGELAIIDDDEVELSNLQRQVVHRTKDIGKPKVLSASRRARELNPGVRFSPLQQRLTSANALRLIGRYDLVLDGSDNFATRYLVADAAEITGTPLVWASILRFQGQVAAFWTGPGAPPLAPGLRDLYPEPPAPGAVPTCAEAGVLGALCGIVGSHMATEAIKLITGLGRQSLLGKVLLIDTLGVGARALTVNRDASRALRTRLEEVPEVPGITVAELSARLAAGAPLVVDVRSAEEFAAGHIPSAVHLPVQRAIAEEGTALRELVPAAAAEFAADAAAVGAGERQPVVLYCTTGDRALATAVAVGREVTAVTLKGGWEAWREAGMPEEFPQDVPHAR